MATVESVRALASALPGSYEAFVRGCVKFRVGRIVYLAFSRDTTLLGFAFPKDEREALVLSEPDTFQLPRPSDMRFNWVVGRLSALPDDEVHHIVVEAWQMVVPKRVAQAFLAG